MPIPAIALARSVSRLLLLALALLSIAALGGCASLPDRDPPRIDVVGIEPLRGEGLELRFAVKLRVQNPNDSAIAYDGVAVELDVNERRFASGVSDQRGSVPRFGETVLTVPVSVSALTAVRQALGLAENADLEDLPYVLRGKLAGGLFGTVRFSDAGRLNLAAPRSGKR